MEEILASIRRIISEDDKPPEAGGDVLDLAPEAAPQPAPPPPAPKAAAPTPQPAPAPQRIPEPAFEAVEEQDVSSDEDDLMVVEDEVTEAQFEEEPVVAAAPPPQRAPEPEPKYEPRPSFRAPPSDDALVGEPAAAKAAGALGKLMGSMMVQSGVTLDDVVREMLKPMLKDWLDANLPQIVETEVAREIERIRRMAR